MMFLTHVALSVLVGLLGIKYFHPSNQILFFFLVILFGALPDIDTGKSKIGRKLPLISHTISFLFGHRGVFHSIYLPIALFFVFNFYFGFSVAVAVALGYASHLLGDALTHQGIKPFHPLHDFQLKGFFSTGSATELIIMGIIIAMDVYYLFSF
ncbi:metal-dependent hydrolase [Nanoarchaeota archaeon]